MIYLAKTKMVVAAQTLKFDDSEKQAKFETISFAEIRDEVNDLKVQVLSEISCFWLFISSFPRVFV